MKTITKIVKRSEMDSFISYLKDFDFEKKIIEIEIQKIAVSFIIETENSQEEEIINNFLK